MKADEIQKCSMCGKGVMHAGIPLFYRLRVETMGVDVKAVQRHAGLEQVFGGGQAGAVLANVMGPGEDIAKPLGEPTTKILCQPCAVKPDLPLLMLLGE